MASQRARLSDAKLLSPRTLPCSLASALPAVCPYVAFARPRGTECYAGMLRAECFAPGARDLLPRRPVLAAASGGVAPCAAVRPQLSPCPSVRPSVSRPSAQLSPTVAAVRPCASRRRPSASQSRPSAAYGYALNSAPIRNCARNPLGAESGEPLGMPKCRIAT